MISLVEQSIDQHMCVDPPRGGWNSDESDRKAKGCMLQFQHATVRVLTHFVAEQVDPRDPKAYFLGSDWQVDVTKLVRYFMKVEDPRVAKLQAGRVLSGRDLGSTAIQVKTWICCSWAQHKYLLLTECEHLD